MANPYANFLNPLPEPLTERELEIVALIADGLSNREIGESLHLAESTVRWHNTQIFGKLGVKNRRQAVTRATELGLFNTSSEPQPPVTHNLPAQTTRFVGRESELSDAVKIWSN